MPDIFLSYNREDQARAKFFADAFKAQGFDVWWDTTLRTGEAYDQVTVKALICDATARRTEAQAALRRFREIEPETSLDLCVHRLFIYFRGIGRLTGAEALDKLLVDFRKLWDETAAN